MRYIDGLALGAATLLAVIYSVLWGEALPMCLSIGVCVGLAVDMVLRRVWPRDAK